MIKKTALVSFLLLISSYGFAAPETSLPQVQTYEQLVSAIREARTASRARIEQAAAIEKVREAWETGKLIDTHVLQHKERAEYGAQILNKLSNDLQTSQSELSFMLQFARAYPNNWPANKLTWSHYQALMSVNDPVKREELAAQAVKERWGRDKLREEVAKLKQPAGVGAGEQGEKAATGASLAAEAGKVGTYKIIRGKYGPYAGQLALDLGFANYYRSSGLDGFTEGDIVRIVASESAPGVSRQTVERVEKVLGKDDGALLYTYNADVVKVTDGDTFDAVVDLGFGIVTTQKLRLRALDAPEVESAEGLAAKQFVEARLTPGTKIRIKTSKSDKYDRYLADVWAGGEYLNQELIENGHAVHVN